jgi:hypothetical protein
MSHIGSGASSGSNPPGTITLNYTLVDTTPYVVLNTDGFLGVDSSALAITIELPNAPAEGRVFIIKDITGDAVSNNITITTVGGVIDIDDAPTFVMNSAFESVQVLFNGTQYLVF